MKPLQTARNHKKMRLSTCLLLVLVACVAVALNGCGYGSSSSSTSSSAPASGIKKRVLVSNAQTGVLQIVDGSKDVLSASSIGVPGAAKMVSNGGFTVIINSNENDVSVVDNTKEQVTQTFGTFDRVMDV